MKKKRTRALALLLTVALVGTTMVPNTVWASQTMPEAAWAPEKLTEDTAQQVQTADEEQQLKIVDGTLQIQTEDQTASTATTKTLTFSNEKLYIAVKKGLTKGKYKYTDLGVQGTSYGIAMTPEEIASVTNLFMAGRSITDPTGLEQFTNLQTLNLESNRGIDIEPLTKITTLRSLSLGYCKLTNIDVLAGLTNLKELNVRSNDLKSIEVFRRMTGLTSLNLNSCELGNVDVVTALTNLTELCISGNKLTNIEMVRNLTNLKILEIAGNRYISDLSPLAKLTELEEFKAGTRVDTISYSFGNQLSDLSPLKNCPKLRVLSLDTCTLTSFDASIGTWNNLEILDLGANSITDVSSITAVRFPKLQELYLGDNEMTTVGNLYQISTLSILCMGLNKLDNNDLKGISNLQNLKKLSMGKTVLNWNGSTGKYWDEEKSGNQITDFTEILKCNSVEKLYLNGMKLTSAEPFFKMKNLKLLDVNQNHIANISERPGDMIVNVREQRVNLIVPNTEVGADLNQCTLLKKALSTDSYYTAQGKYELVNSSLSTNQRYLKLEAGTTSGSITIEAGHAAQTVATISLGTVSITGAKVAVSNCVYNGKKQKPKVKLTYNNAVMKEGRDYTLECKANKKVGLATVTIKAVEGSGYEGSLKKNFYILPKKVAHLKAVKSTTTSIALNWKKVTGATGYQIYRYDSSTKKWRKVSTVKKNKATLKKLSSGTTYKYRVRAIAKINGKTKAGAFSATLTTATKPATPVLKIKAGTRKASLSWKKVKGASGYRIYMATKKNGTYKRVKTITKGKTVSYKKTKLTKGKTYYFKMRAYKKVGNKYYYSSYSKIRKIKITK